MCTAHVKDESGKVEYLVTHIQDINEQKKIEQELRKSEEKYKELVDNARSIIVKQDAEGIFTFFNEYAQSLFGYKADEVLGKTAMQTIVPEYDDSGHEMSTLLKNIYKNPDRYQININENIKKNGERIIVEWHNKALFDPTGKRTGHISVGLDITKRMLAEKEVQKSKEKLDMILKNAKVGLWEWDLTSDNILLDERSGKMFGISPGELSKNFTTLENCIHGEDIPHFKSAIHESVLLGIPFETVIRTKPVNGESNYISCRALINKDIKVKPVCLS
jgi:PAS domain S-box-containing protein